MDAYFVQDGRRRMVICSLHFDLHTQVTLYMSINRDGKHGYKRMRASLI